MQYSMHNILLGLKPNRTDYRYQTPPASSSRIYSGRGLRWTLGIANSSCHIFLKDVMNMISYRCGTTTTSSSRNTSGTYHHYYYHHYCYYRHYYYYHHYYYHHYYHHNYYYHYYYHYYYYHHYY